jgi:hypothetical protein
MIHGGLIVPRRFVIPILLLLSSSIAFADYHYASHTDSNTYPNTSWEYDKSTACFFTPNLGQWDESVLFRASIGNASYYFKRNGLAMLLLDKDYKLDVGDSKLNLTKIIETSESKNKSALVSVEFLGANPNAELSGEDPLPFYHNYFLGNDHSRWRAHVPNFSSIIYMNVYPGIDIRYYGALGTLKYDIIVKPEKDASNIAMRYAGAKKLSLTENGELMIETSLGALAERVPSTYLLKSTNKEEITGNYTLIDSVTVGFKVQDKYNSVYPLIIDPELIFSTFLGGSNDEIAHAVGIDSAGYCIVSGTTTSSDFPRINPYDSTYDGYGDIFISKFSPTGDSLVFSTYLGSSGGNESPFSLSIDIDNCIYVGGFTNSSNFPLANPFDDHYNQGQDAVVFKLSTQGDSLIYSTYLGGGGGDDARDIAVDNVGCAYVVGTTSSIDFPMVNAFDSEYGSTYDAYLAKFSTDGGSLIYSTFLGGTGPQDGGYAVAVDSGHCPYVVGITQCSDFPTRNAFDNHYNGGQGDGFLSKFAASGDSLIYSTYLGGSDEDYASEIAVDNSGQASIIGDTYSSNFPTVNPFIGNLRGDADIFVTQFSTTGDSLVFSTYFGGSSYDNGWGIGLDSIGNIYIISTTYSTDFPTCHAFDSTGSGNEDAAFAILSPDGGALLYGTYMEGADPDYAFGLAVEPTGQACLTGWTRSTDFTTVNAYQPERNGWADVFLAKFGPSLLGCPYQPGDINGDGEVNGSDVLYSVIYFKGGENPSIDCTMCRQIHPFYAAGDVNGSCVFNGVDITYYVRYLKGIGSLEFCADCPPHY